MSIRDNIIQAITAAGGACLRNSIEIEGVTQKQIRDNLYVMQNSGIVTSRKTQEGLLYAVGTGKPPPTGKAGKKNKTPKPRAQPPAADPSDFIVAVDADMALIILEGAGAQMRRFTPEQTLAIADTIGRHFVTE
jgi:hypothetical protein